MADTVRPLRTSAIVCPSRFDIAPEIGSMNLPHRAQIPPLLGSRLSACSEPTSLLLLWFVIS
jgi:hypothetical protein